MTFNETLTKHQSNLDNTHDALLNAGDRESLETESLENEILADEELFGRLARRFLLDDGEELGERNLLRQGFLVFAVDQLRRERSPQWEGGWKNE